LGCIEAKIVVRNVVTAKWNINNVLNINVLSKYCESLPRPENRTGKSVAVNSAGELPRLFLWGADDQSAFNASFRRMQCDHKSMTWRKRLDFAGTESMVAMPSTGKISLTKCRRVRITSA
jgi:hypothetical protein